MTLTSDILLERQYLKRKLTFWRLLIIIITAIILIIYIEDSDTIGNVGQSYIARIEISNTILDDKNRDKILQEIADNDKIKAVILYMNSPGGSAVGGEELYNQLKNIAKNKPVIALMRSICTSACYMAALASDHIMAMNGTITGSIGVIIQTAEITNLLKKIGIKPIIIKSAELKATPSPIEKVTDKQINVIKNIINDSYQSFVSLVANSRKIEMKDAIKIADGRVYSAKKSLKLNLIDEIGSEKQAIYWLEKNKNIKKNINIKDVSTKKKDSFLKKIFDEETSTFLGKIKSLTPSNGLMMIWSGN